MDKLVLSLEREFKKLNTECSLIVDVFLPSPRASNDSLKPDLDALAFINGQIAIIELKNFQGRVEPSFVEGQPWLINGTPETELIKKEKTTYDQVKRQRLVLADFLSLFVLGTLTDKFHANGRKVLSGVFSYVVFPDETEIVLRSGTEYDTKVEVMNLRQVPRRLHWVTGVDPILTKAEFDRFLSKICAKERSLWDWLDSGDHPMPSVDSSPAIPVLDDLLSSDQPDDVLKGLSYIKELKLYPYLTYAAEHATHTDSRIRQESLEILYELDPQMWQNSIVAELYGEESHLMETILGKLCTFTELVGSSRLKDALKKIIENGSFEYSASAIMALARTTGSDVDEYFFSMLRRHIDNGTFRNLDGVISKIEELKSENILNAGHSPDYCERSERLNREKSIGLNLLKTLIKVFEDRKSGLASDILLELMLHPQKLGLASFENAYKKPADENLDYIDLFARASRCLVSVGTKLPEIDIVQAIGEGSDDYLPFLLSLIDADVPQSALDAVMQLLDRDDSNVRLAAMKALGRMRAKKAFDRILRIYESDVSRGIFETEAGGVLEQISPERFEKYLCRRIDEMENKDDAFFLFYYLRRIATDYSVDTLFRWTSDRFLYMNASELLNRLAMHGTEGILEKAEQMLDAPNPRIRASGLLILSDSLIHTAGAISRYEKDPSEEVRSVVVGLYASLAEEDGLFRLLNSSQAADERNDIFVGLISINHDRFFNFSVSYADDSGTEAEIVVCRKDLLLKMGENVIAIESSQIERMGVLEYNDDAMGLYLICGNQRAYLFAPVSRFSLSSANLYIRDFQSELTKMTGLALKQEDVAAETGAKMLWGDFVTKNPSPLYAQINREEIRYVNYART